LIISDNRLVIASATVYPILRPWTLIMVFPGRGDHKPGNTALGHRLQHREVAASEADMTTLAGYPARS
jgi:hypothetical protein